MLDPCTPIAFFILGGIMTQLKVFESEEFGKVRTVEIDGDLWFSGKDVAEALGYTNPRKAILDHVDIEDRGVTKCDTPGGKQDITIINESGLYSLVISSKLSSAKRFKHWVTSEVIPSIRKNGGYIANQENLSPEQIVANALIVAQNIIADRDRQIAEMKPKADFFDSVADSKTAISMNEVAKVLDIRGYGRNNLFEFLRKQGILDRFNVPYQRYVDCGWFRVIEQRYMKNGEPQVTTKTLVYQKGVDAIRRIVMKEI